MNSFLCATHAMNSFTSLDLMFLLYVPSAKKEVESFSHLFCVCLHSSNFWSQIPLRFEDRVENKIGYCANTVQTSI